MKMFYTDGKTAYYRYAVFTKNEQLVMISYFAKSRQIVRGIGAAVKSGCSISMEGERYYTEGISYAALNTMVENGYDAFSDGFIYNQQINSGILITTQDTLLHDLYHAFMHNYDLPLEETWMKALYKQLIVNNEICVGQHIFYGHETETETMMDVLEVAGIQLSKILIVDYSNLTSERLESCLSECIKSGDIVITEKPQKKLDVKSVDDYVFTYGEDIVANIHDKVVPVTQVDGTYPYSVTRSKRLYASQADCTRGIVTCLDTGKYCILNEGMGCGKSLQSVVGIDGYETLKYMRSHKGSDLRSVYSDPYALNYRVILMAPGHLLKKWQEEIEKEIPYANVVILNKLSQLEAIKREGPDCIGKNFYIIGKDFGKLSYTLAPLPTRVREKIVRKSVCVDCGKDKIGVGYTACECGSRKYKQLIPHQLIKREGLVCPECGELLLPNKEVQNWDAVGDDEITVLTPSDFATHTSSNDKCWHCGCKLWQPYVNNTGGNHTFKWYRAKRYKNATRKETSTIWLLRNHEYDYIECKGGPGCKTIADFLPYKDIRNRKVSPLQYLHTHLNGYFDYAVLDEVHKYKAGGTAQGVASAWLINASKKTLALTGTLSGGKAEDLFYMFYRLDPKRMQEAGYSYDDVSKFNHRYGCTEQRYAYDSEEDEANYNASSRGRQTKPLKVMPGISPLVFLDFLIDRTIFLDLMDMSNQLPPLNEYVVGVELEDDIKKAYQDMLRDFSELFKMEKRAVLSTRLQYALSYTDKPYGRSPVLSTLSGKVAFEVANLDQYKKKLLNKEKKLVEIVKKELNEGRRIFVYAEYTRTEETNITGRLKGILEKEIPDLVGRIAILESGKPDTIHRMDWIKEKAAEGIQVIITNPKLCECGLDFVFEHEGKTYNYPTIIQYQMGYDLCVLWQSVSRHFRLIQTEECRTYYLYSKDTIQLEVLRLMAKKKNAVTVLQGGGFSSEGLASMAEGVNVESALAYALQKGLDESVEQEVTEMYQHTNKGNKRQYEAGFISHPLLHELLGKEPEWKKNQVEQDMDTVLDLFSMMESKEESIEETEASINELSEIAANVVQISVTEKTRSRKTIAGQLSFNLF